MIETYLIVVLALLSTAVFIDIHSHRIPNVLVAVIILLGLATQSIQDGIPGLLAASFGVIVGALLLFPFYVGGAMGAGDVKLMGAVGALLGPMQVSQAVLATLIFGGALGLLVVVCSRQSKLFFARYGCMAKTWVHTGQFVYLPRTAADPASKRFAYAAAIALGTVFTLFQNHAFDAVVRA